MENVTIYPLATLRTSDEMYARTGHGIEFTFFIGERTRPMSNPTLLGCLAICRTAVHAGRGEERSNHPSRFGRDGRGGRNRNGTYGNDMSLPIPFEELNNPLAWECDASVR